jgi:integrase
VWPKQPKTKVSRHIAKLQDVKRLVAEFPTAESRAIAALREGVGADWDALEPTKMTRSNIIDPRERIVLLDGDKTENRRREVEVEPWAWRYVAEYLRAHPAPPTAPMFTVAERTYRDLHCAVVHRLRARGVAIPARYTPHNGRHSFAVRKRRAGWPDWKIAEYLGNTPQEVAKTYGAFQPTRRDLRQNSRVPRKKRV